MTAGCNLGEKAAFAFGELVKTALPQLLSELPDLIELSRKTQVRGSLSLGLVFPPC
jgi:hypothetical protein